MKKLITALALVAAAFTASAACTQHFPAGTEPVLKTAKPDARRMLCFDGFAILHSGQSKTAVYVVEKLNKARLAPEIDRNDKFYEEARLPKAERATLNDYKGSGYDRGHLAPAADMGTPNEMAQSFSLANMVPQVPEHNRGIWAKSIEKPTRQYVEERAKGDVFVFTGPIYKNNMPAGTIGAGKVWVPQQMFKLVYDASTKRAWAHISDNSADARMGPPVTYKELVRVTGIEFLPNLTVKD
jgi:endonuclease G